MQKLELLPQKLLELYLRYPFWAVKRCDKGSVIFVNGVPGLSERPEIVVYLAALGRVRELAVVMMNDGVAPPGSFPAHAAEATAEHEFFEGLVSFASPADRPGLDSAGHFHFHVPFSRARPSRPRVNSGRLRLLRPHNVKRRTMQISHLAL